MLYCLKRWLWFRQEGRVELGLEAHLVLVEQGLDLGLVHLELMLALGPVVELEELDLDQELVVLELVLGQGLQDLEQGLEVLALDLEQGVEELVVLGQFQVLGVDCLLALGPLEEPWVLLPLLEPLASLELSNLDYHKRPFHVIIASSPCVWASQLSMLSGPAMTRCGTQHASCVVLATNYWWT